MPAITIDPVYLQIGGPALLAGLILGGLIVWLVQRQQKKVLQQSVEALETRIKDQDTLQAEIRGLVSRGFFTWTKCTFSAFVMPAFFIPSRTAFATSSI